MQRSVSSVSGRPVCGIRAVRGKMLLPSNPSPVSSTSSGSLGSSSFVSPKPYISSESPANRRYHNLPTLPSSNSAFRRPKPVHSKARELEQYARQWQHWACRRNIRDLNSRMFSDDRQPGKTSVEREDLYSSKLSTKSLTLPRKMEPKQQEYNSNSNSWADEQHYSSLPRPKISKVKYNTKTSHG